MRLGGGNGGRFIRGIAKVGVERLVILLDLDKILTATRNLSLGIAA